MGRTVLPFSRVLEQEVQEWRKFRRGLRKEDQQFLDRLFGEARLHVQAGVYASRPWPFETILVSILLEHEKALVELRSKIKAIEEKEQKEFTPMSAGGRLRQKILPLTSSVAFFGEAILHPLTEHLWRFVDGSSTSILWSPR